MKQVKKSWLTFIAVLLVFTLTACSSGTDIKSATETSQPTATPKPDPVELSLYIDLAGELTEADIDRYIREPLKKQHPHITIGKVISRGTGTQRQDMITSGNFPDLIYTSILYIPELKLLDLPQDLSALAKQQNFDFSKTFNELTVRNLATLSGNNGTMLGMPFSANRWGTIYNKDIFDKFNVPYPKELMSWEEALDLSKKLTRKDSEIQYIGLDAHAMIQATYGLSLPFVDPATMKSTFNTEPFRQVFTFFKDLYEVPGHTTDKGVVRWGTAGFFDTKNVAMLVGPIGAFIGKSKPNDGLNWEITTAFNFKNALGTERSMDAHLLMVSSTSKHKEAAFQVVSMITSDDIQKEMARNGRVPAALEFSEYQTIFAEASSHLKQKNWASVFKATPRDIFPITEHQTSVTTVFNTAQNRLAINKIDVNTLMRELQEKADAAIELEKKK